MEFVKQLSLLEPPGLAVMELQWLPSTSRTHQSSSWDAGSGRASGWIRTIIICTWALITRPKEFISLPMSGYVHGEHITRGIKKHFFKNIDFTDPFHKNNERPCIYSFGVFFFSFWKDNRKRCVHYNHHTMFPDVSTRDPCLILALIWILVHAKATVTAAECE